MSEEKEVKEEDKEKKCSCKKNWIRRIGSILLGLVVVIVIAVCALLIFLDSVVKTGIETVGSTVTKCKVTVEHVSISILRGKVEMGDLVVGNPEGYKTDSAFKLGKIHVAMNPLSLFMGKRTYIKEIIVEDPEITYELNPLELTSNIGTIQKNVESMLPAKDEKEEEKKEELKEKKEGRPIEISLITVSGGKIRLAATFTGGMAVPVPLPTITLNDIGKEKEITPPEATATVLDKVCTSVVTQAKNTTKTVEDAGKALGQSAEQMGKAAKALGKSTLEMGKSLFKSAKDKIQEKTDK